MLKKNFFIKKILLYFDSLKNNIEGRTNEIQIFTILCVAFSVH